MSSKTIALTGCAKGVGRATALALGVMKGDGDLPPGTELHLYGALANEREEFEAVADQCGANRAEMGDLFNRDTSDFVGDQFLSAPADVKASIAAHNMENCTWANRMLRRDREKQVRSRKNQNEFHQQFLDWLVRQGDATGISVNSQYGIWGRAGGALSFVAGNFSEYTLMKAEQLDMNDVMRNAIKRARSKLIVLCPGAIDTGFDEHLKPSGVQRLINMAGVWMRFDEKKQDWVYTMCPQIRGRFRNEEILTPENMGWLIASLIRRSLEGEEIPPEAQRMNLGKNEDCRPKWLNQRTEQFA